MGCNKKKVKIVKRKVKKMSAGKNSLTLSEIQLYLEYVVNNGKPVCLQLNFEGCNDSNTNLSKSGFSLYIVKERIGTEDIAKIVQ